MKKAWCLAAILFCARTTNAAERVTVGFMMDFVAGVSVPIHDGDYRNFADASFKTGLRLAPVFHVTRHFAIAPEGEFDFSPVTPDKTGSPSAPNTSYSIWRVRGLWGVRFIIHFGVGSVYFRGLAGVDHFNYNVSYNVRGFGASQDYTSTGFTLEPGFGVQFNVHRHIVVGVTSGFPVAWHDFGNNRPRFTAVDADFLGVFGLRF